ncbi:MAG TPA: hypothetical protein VFH80_10420 [Solirubrobacteraceae bacterium]|nr:hypothetical protein [Solirubrobacteraceae bacterium]
MPTGSSTLQLVRSFDIPTDDPSYVRLINRSWTDAPLQADQAVTSVAYGEDCHVWPAAAAGAWMLLAGHTVALFG